MFRIFERFGNYLNRGDPRWTQRRRLVWVITLWSFGLSVWALGWEEDREIAVQLIKTSAETVFWVLAIYVGSAVADDNTRKWIKMRNGNGIEPAPAAGPVLNPPGMSG